MISMTLFRSLSMNSQVSVAQTQGRNRLLGPWNQFLQMQWFLWWWLRMATEQNSHALPKPRIASKPSTIRPALPKIIKVFLIFCAHNCEGQRRFSLWRTHRPKKKVLMVTASTQFRKQEFRRNIPAASNWVWHCWSISGRPQWRQQQALNRSWKCNAKVCILYIDVYSM